jgi:uncharacterized membrane protein
VKSKSLAVTIVLAALYNCLGFVFQSIAFGAIQIRVADALYPLIAVLGLPCLIGTFLGHFLFNLYGYSVGIALGIGDLASPIIFLIPKFFIYKWKLKAVPLHVIFVAFWVSWLLYIMFGIPYWISILTVGVGEGIAEIALGIPLALSVKRCLRIRN